MVNRLVSVDENYIFPTPLEARLAGEFAGLVEGKVPESQIPTRLSEASLSKVATTTTSGLMAASDKTKLDGIPGFTASATPDTGVRRDANGDFAVGNILKATDVNTDPRSLTNKKYVDEQTAKVKTDLASSAALGVVGVGTAPDPTFYQQRIIAPLASNRMALKIDQRNTGANDALKITNESAGYALKIDHVGTTPFDAVNINAPGTGQYTVLGVGGSNTSFSTVKITNNGAQTGGAVVAAYGTVPARTAVIYQAENYGSGASFAAHQWEGANAPAFRAIYDAGYNHNARALWIDANHNDGSIVYVNNATAQTSGQMVNLTQAAGSTAPIIQINNNGTGDHITANNFKVSQGGNVSAVALVNTTSFSNARLQMTALGAVIDRNIADASATLRVNSENVSSTGDIVQLQAAGAVKARFTKAGHLALRTNAAPADADVVAGELAFWFDSTNGASKLMVKAKQADGTIKTGAVTLA